MIKNTFHSFAYDRRAVEYTAALVVYNDSELFQDDNFLEYIEEIMEKIGKATKRSSTAIIFADKNNFILDFHSAKMEFDLVNQLMFFKNDILTSTLFIDDLIEEFKKQQA